MQNNELIITTVPMMPFLSTPVCFFSLRAVFSCLPSLSRSLDSFESNTGKDVAHLSCSDVWLSFIVFIRHNPLFQIIHIRTYCWVLPCVVCLSSPWLRTLSWIFWGRAAVMFMTGLFAVGNFSWFSSSHVAYLHLIFSCQCHKMFYYRLLKG